MKVRLVSWNINSIRLRQNMVQKYLERNCVDIICLQETKCPNHFFPLEIFIEKGYQYYAISGQKSYNGVAILSRLPLHNQKSHNFCQKHDCRHLSVDLQFADQKITLHNFYVPAGGDIPDPRQNEKFAHKLAFLEEMEYVLEGYRKNAILVGDLNVAPLVSDVWSHKQLLNVVSHTPIECEALTKIQAIGPYVDIMRQKWPEPEKLYSWWSYRAKDWRQSNRGRRLDHIWVSEDLASKVKDVRIAKNMRGRQKPSDHVPLHALLEF